MSRPECAALTDVITISIPSNRTARRVDKNIQNYDGGRRITARKMRTESILETSIRNLCAWYLGGGIDS